MPRELQEEQIKIWKRYYENQVEICLGAPARCRQSTIRRLVLALLVTSLLILTAPSPGRAQPLLPHQPILIVGNSSFTPANGVTQGSGTIQSPYVIENWEITANTTAGIHIRNTQSYFVIRNVFIHPSHLSPDSSGILLENVVNGRIQDSRIANNTYGVWLALVSHNTITANAMWNNTYGMYMTGSNNIISNNHLYNNTKYGFWVSSAFSSTFIGNNATTNGNQTDGEGFVISSSSNNVIANNTVSGNTWYGLRIILSSDNIFKNNNVTKNQFGMIFTGSFQNLAYGNLMTNNGFGIGLENIGQASQSNNNITKNMLTGNGYGIYVVNSTRNMIYNNYLNNTSNAYDDNTTNVWNIAKTLRTNILGGPFQGGNFYSDYQGSDPDGDGIGDSSYQIQGGPLGGLNQDTLPLYRTQPTTVHDVAVSHLTAQPSSARAGATITITTTVLNQGTASESFTVTLTHNQTIITTRNIVNLPAWSNITLSQDWNSAGLNPGTYVLIANASIVASEINTANNISPPTFVSLTLNKAPVAKFLTSSTSALVGKTINFDASSSYDPDGTIMAYAWNFGDGSPTGSTATPSHSYSAAGTYTITLTVTDNEGARGSVSKSVTILSNQPGAAVNLNIAATSASATLTWSPPGTSGGSPITGYKVYRGTSPSALQLLSTIGNVTSYVDGSVNNGQTFYYQVTAVNQAGMEGPPSTTQDVLVPATNTPNLPNYPIMWYAIAGAIVLAGAVGGIITIRRRKNISRTTT